MTLSAFPVLRAYLEARASFTEDEMAFVRDRFVSTTLAAGGFLQRAREVTTHAAFVATAGETGPQSGGPGRGSYSARMAMTGSIRVARRAGTSPAIAATTMRTTRLAR